MNDGLFFNGFVYLAAAALAAPLGRRFGVGAVLGYLIVGAVVGPSAFGWVGDNREEVMHFAEFGVVLMLFVIGLEIDLSRLWKMRGPILGLGGLQVLLSTVVLAGAAWFLLQSDWREALAMGMILALSSTAIVMQTLRERGISDTSSGVQSFAVLLFQDIAVIPMIAFLPVLAFLPTVGGDVHGGGHVWIESLPDWSRGFVVVGAIALIVVIGKFVLSPWLRWVASLKVPEALTSTTLALVVGVALLMNAVGLSAALGTFVAGVMLASSEFRHELESDIEPFKALLLAVFFIAVGAGIDFALIASKPVTIGLMVFGLIALKGLVLFGVAKWFGMALDQRLLFAAALAQGGEFAFVLGGFAVGQGVIGPEMAGQMIAAVALSMAVAPPLLLFVQKVILPRVGTTESSLEQRPHDVENDKSRVLLAGFGRFGHPIARLLRSAGHMPTVLERDSDHVDYLRRIGLKCYYGDATRPALLKSAGAEDAELLILAIDDEDECMGIIETCRKHFPHLKLFARACSRQHAFQLHEAGVKFFVEQLGSSLDCAISVLGELGHCLDHAKDAARRFKEHEMASIEETAPHHRDEKLHMNFAQKNIEDLDSLLLDVPMGKRGVDECD